MQEENTCLTMEPDCHVGCRNKYIHKKVLHNIGTKGAKSDNSADTVHEEARIVGWSMASRGCTSFINNKTNCFICEKPRDSKGKWQLILVATKQRQSMHR
jgi:hypothetical protein